MHCVWGIFLLRNNPHIYIRKRRKSFWKRLFLGNFYHRKDDINTIVGATFHVRENWIEFTYLGRKKFYLKTFIHVINHEMFHAIFYRLDLDKAFMALDNKEYEKIWWIS